MENLHLKSFLEYKFLSNLDFNPEGKNLAFSLSESDYEKNSYKHYIYSLNTETKEVRNSRINPTAVTDEFKSEVGKICDILGVREPDLVRSAVESYVNSLYSNGEVIKFYDEFEKTGVGTYYVAGEYYENIRDYVREMLYNEGDDKAQKLSEDAVESDKNAYPRQR